MKNLYLVTGFLGAGKTTFLNNLLTDYSKKTAVIVNEFGEQGIDGSLIAQNEGIQIQEINNGSIFCCCRMLDFANALVDIAKTDVETVFVEASGLADPSNLEDIVTGANSRCDNEYQFAGTICIVDAVNFLKLSTALPALISQVEKSDYILINKSDLSDENTISEINDKVSSINGNATIYKTSYSKMPNLPEKALDMKPSDPSTNTPTNRPKTKVIIPKPLNDKSLPHFIKKVSKRAYRAKGFVTYNGQKKYLDVVGDEYSLKDASPSAENKFVLLKMKK